MEDFSQKYRDFFRDSPAGQRFVEQIESNHILQNYQKAENASNPDDVIMFMSRAKGNREILNMIKSLITEAKKPNI